VPLTGRQARLRTTEPPAAEQAPDGEAQSAREVVSLVEAPGERAPRVQRHRDDGIGPVEDLVSRRSHQRGQRLGQEPS
jgi:hypothetical protein